MSFWRRHRWNRRFLIGFAFAVMAVPGQAMAIDSASVLGEAVKTRQSTAEPVAVPADAVERAVQAKLAAETPQVINYLSHGLTAADALDPRSGIPLSAGIPVAGDPFVVGLEPTKYSIEPGRSWYLVADPTPARPDDRIDRFVVDDVPPVAPATDGDGFTFDWENGLTVGFGALALAFGLGIALMYMRRPRIAV